MADGIVYETDEDYGEDPVPPPRSLSREDAVVNLATALASDPVKRIDVIRAQLDLMAIDVKDISFTSPTAYVAAMKHITQISREYAELRGEKESADTTSSGPHTGPEAARAARDARRGS